MAKTKQARPGGFTLLAQEILALAIKLDAQLLADGRPETSFENDTLENLSADIEATRNEFVDKLQTTKRLSLGARGTLWELGFQFTDEMTLRAIYDHRLPHHVPVDGSETFAGVAKASGLDAALTERLLRQAMANHIFSEAPGQPGRVVHTATSRLLATDSDAMDAIGMITHEFVPVCGRFGDALAEFGPADCSGNNEPTKAASALIHNGSTMYEYLAQNPDRARRFGAGMRYFGRGQGWDLGYLVHGFPWSEFDTPGTTLVDVGGGHGTVSQALASATEHLHFVVQDLPGTVRDGAAALPSPLAGRISFEAHDFFEPQLRKGTDIFFLRWILHNWSDERALRILKSLIPGMKNGTRVIIYEFVLSDGPETRLSRKQPRCV